MSAPATVVQETSTIPVQAEPAEEKKGFLSWFGLGGNRRKSKKATRRRRASLFVKQVSIVNGRVVMNREMRCVTKGRRLRCKTRRLRMG